MPYTTRELIQILEQELQANWQGQRWLPSVRERVGHAVVALAISPERLSMVFAFEDFRAQVQAYQQQQGVSGIVWRTCRFREAGIEIPEVHGQLCALARDKERLMHTKPAMVDFWWEQTQGLNYWWVHPHTRPVTAQELAQALTQAEWLELDATRTELYLGLCWGDPKEYRYQWARPASGCDRVVAAVALPQAIKV
ncbi:hypothetical protein GlitD10_0576 [Gloeomargarita lithophora Alchichica-D10]|uniref:Uncharacterized protein n=1 Tax=Gloeomargarita lithophora Alchichica-D10 TaxID=1188229 RepID=A0A1J0AAD4_9CYAN|nr:hypothetical protein [Gloeomargarita lithophora]APB32890.1 hypothetical protein GlitD10_0576 [Gloeomargarita lithophora Alchichica-D10]